MSFLSELDIILKESLDAVLPENAVKECLKDFVAPEGRLILIAIGKAGYTMAKAALDTGITVHDGIIITKYGHAGEPLPGIRCFEAGHPLPDENGMKATEEAWKLTEHLTEKDEVLFLVSGGGSALFTKPLISLEELDDINQTLISCGASITEINRIRKRLSAVKGGRFGLHCAPAKVLSLILSDVVGDPLDMIASGPSVGDPTTVKETLSVIQKYGLSFSEEVMDLLRQETPKEVPNNQSKLVGNVSHLCAAAAKAVMKLGYQPMIINTAIDGEAREEGQKLAYMAVNMQKTITNPVALIQGGEPVVTMTKKGGKGGRNQEFAFAAAPILEGYEIALFSVGSDGTDGPTDAAGGYVDGNTMSILKKHHVDWKQIMMDHNTYPVLEALHGLIKTGPTGTNVNDLQVALLMPLE